MKKGPDEEKKWPHISHRSWVPDIITCVLYQSWVMGTWYHYQVFYISGRDFLNLPSTEANMSLNKIDKDYTVVVTANLGEKVIKKFLWTDVFKNNYSQLPCTVVEVETSLQRAAKWTFIFILVHHGWWSLHPGRVHCVCPQYPLYIHVLGPDNTLPNYVSISTMQAIPSSD